MGVMRLLRRRGPAQPLPLPVADALARRTHARGLAELAAGSWGVVVASALEHPFVALALAVVGAVGVFDCLVSRRVLACLELPDATAELRADALLVVTPRRSAWLPVSSRALARVTS